MVTMKSILSRFTIIPPSTQDMSKGYSSLPGPV